MTHLSVTDALLLVVRLADEVPEPEDVKAGWTAFAVFLLLILAVAVLGFSLTKRLRNAQAAEDAGLYDHDPAQAPPDAEQDGVTDADRAESQPEPESPPDSEPRQAP